MQFLETHKINNKTKIFFIFVLFTCFLMVSPKAEAQKKYTIVLDAGHGGKDPGKVGYRNYKEKDIALKITLKVGQLLKQNKDIKVVYTRTTDKFVDLWKRGTIANEANADLFVSIHCNAHTSQARGTETWVLGVHANKKNFEVAKRENAVILLEDNFHEKYKGFDPNSPESVIGLSLMQEDNLDKSLAVASIIQQHFKSKLTRVNRGVKQAGFVVLHQTTMPSVLIETGFLTNKQEGRYLNSKKGQSEISSSIAYSIKKYVAQLKLNTVVSYEDQSSKVSSTGVVYKVQIASSKTKLATKSYNFKGLQNVTRDKVGAYYKYFYGNTSNYSKIVKELSKAKQKGYKTAWIVAFKNGEKISVQEALKMN